MAYNENNVNMNFRLPASLRDAMRARADYLGINVSQFFRNAIEKELNIDRPATLDKDLKGVAEGDTKSISFFCPIALADSFNETCKRLNVPKSLVLRQFLQDYVDTHKEG